MLIISLILLLLSNSITLRRDKSILYSRATITILLISSLATYDNLYFLFLIRSLFFLKIGTVYLLFKYFSIYYLTSTQIPKVHTFTNLCLHSSPPIGEGELQILKNIRKQCKTELLEANEAFKTLQKALDLEKIIQDKSKNRSMQEIMSYYKEFFDEDSGNTRNEGLKQLFEELSGDLTNKHNEYKKAKENLEQFISKSKSQSIMFIIPHFNLISLKHLLPFITSALSILSLFVTITYFFPDLYEYICICIPEFIFDIRNYIQSIIKYEIITDLPAFIWYFFKIWQNTKRYIKIGYKIKDNICNTYFLFLLYIFIVLVIYSMLLFIFTPEELLNTTNILALILFNI